MRRISAVDGSRVVLASVGWSRAKVSLGLKRRLKGFYIQMK